MWVKLKLKQCALVLLLINSAAFADDISQLDGDWYSFKWKYGYSLSNGKGIAFATNSPNFKVGQEIVRLTAVGKNSFVGENVYKDGKFYKVKATLGQDGKLFFEGEKNVKWEMEKIDSEKMRLLSNNKSVAPSAENSTDLGRCWGTFNVYAENGGTLSVANKNYIKKYAYVDKVLNGAIEKVNSCRGSDVSGEVHEECSNSLPAEERLLYVAYVVATGKMKQYYVDNSKAKISSMVLACSIVDK